MCTRTTGALSQPVQVDEPDFEEALSLEILESAT